MKASTALIYWTVCIFLWLYLLPILLIGTIICIPIFIVITPILMTISLSVMYLLKDELVPDGSIRRIVNNIPYHLWFGEIDTMETLPTPHLICSHPHGVLCTGILFSVHFRPGSTTLFAVSKWLFTIPLIGWLAHHLGCIPATYEHIEKALQTHSVILVPGGVPELITGKSYTKRYGFLKIAKKTNAMIKPVTTTNTYFDLIPCPLEGLRMYLAIHYGFPIMFPVLGWYGSWLPKRNPIKMTFHDGFEVNDSSIEENRVRYYTELA